MSRVGTCRPFQPGIPIPSSDEPLSLGEDCGADAGCDARRVVRRRVIRRRVVPPEAVERRAVDLRAVDLRAVDLRAVLFRRVVVFRAVVLRAPVFRAVVFRRVVVFRAVVFRAPVLRAPVDRRVDDLRVVDDLREVEPFRALDLRVDAALRPVDLRAVELLRVELLRVVVRFAVDGLRAVDLRDALFLAPVLRVVEARPLEVLRAADDFRVDDALRARFLAAMWYLTPMWPASLPAIRPDDDATTRCAQWEDARMRKMKYEIYLLRHGHAGDPNAWKGDDAARPLSAKGRQQAKRLGKFLAQAGFRPDVVISSPKVRARETAELVGSRLGVDVELDERVADGFDVRGVRDLVKRFDSGRIVFVGHDPDFSELLASLVGAPAIPMPKGAIARIDFDVAPAPGRGALRWLLPPDALQASD